MELRAYFISFAFLICCLLPSLSSLAIDTPETDISIDNRDARQLGLIRRAANSTRGAIKFIRDYSAHRLYNASAPAPESTIGKQAVNLLQYVTISNIRDAFNKLISSEAAPVVANFVNNLDKDTLQLFNSPDRTYEGIITRTHRNRTTTAKPATNSTSSTGAKDAGSNSTTTVASLTVESTTKQPVILGVDDIRHNINAGTDKRKLQPENEDDEDESIEDD